jgi:hypothetical protein
MGGFMYLYVCVAVWKQGCPYSLGPCYFPKIKSGDHAKEWIHAAFHLGLKQPNYVSFQSFS